MANRPSDMSDTGINELFGDFPTLPQDLLLSNKPIALPAFGIEVRPRLARDLCCSCFDAFVDDENDVVCDECREKANG